MTDNMDTNIPSAPLIWPTLWEIMSLRDYFASKVELSEDIQERIMSIDMGTLKQFVGRDYPREDIDRIGWWMELEAKFQYMKADAMLKIRENDRSK